MRAQPGASRSSMREQGFSAFRRIDAWRAAAQSLPRTARSHTPKSSSEAISAALSRATNWRTCQSSLARSAGSSGARSRRSTFPRRRTAQRATGSIEGMVYARPKIPPTRNGASVRSIDDSAARSVKGYISCLALEDPSDTVPGWVMVFASSYPAAIRAADRVKVDWTAGEGANVSEQDVLDHGAKQIADPKGGVFLVDDEGVDAAFRAAKSTLAQTYTTSSVLHVQLEPVNALAFEKDGIFEIHTGNQWQSLILPVLSKALGLPQERIVLRTYY